MHRAWLRSGLLLLAPLALAAGGCMQTNTTREDLLLAAVLESQAEARRARAHVDELESRLATLEHERKSTPFAACDSNSSLPRPDVAERDELPSQGESDDVAASEDFPVGDDSNPSEAQAERLRFKRSLEELRRYSLDWRSGVSREQREALRVLLRRNRALDGNPWLDY